MYKIVKGEAPFPDTDDVKDMISARSWGELQAVFNRDGALEADTRQSRGKRPDEYLKFCQRIIYSVSHGFSGFILWVNTFVGGAEALAPSTEGANPMGPISAILGIVVAGSQGGGAALARRHPIENRIVDSLSIATTVLSIETALLFSAPVQKRLAISSTRFRGLAVNDGRATGAIAKSLLVIQKLFVTGWHFYELGRKNAGVERSAAIIGEVTNIADCTATISYDVAVNAGPGTTPPKLATVAVMTGANITGGELQTARAALPN